MLIRNAVVNRWRRVVKLTPRSRWKTNAATVTCKWVTLKKSRICIINLTKCYYSCGNEQKTMHICQGLCFSWPVLVISGGKITSIYGSGGCFSAEGYHTSHPGTLEQPVEWSFPERCLSPSSVWAASVGFSSLFVSGSMKRHGQQREETGSTGTHLDRIQTITLRNAPRIELYVQYATQLVSIFYLNPFLIASSLDNSVNIDTGDVDVLCGERSDLHHLLHLSKDAEWWAPPSPVTRLTPLQIKAQITARVDETTLPENNLCLWAVKFNT